MRLEFNTKDLAGKIRYSAERIITKLVIDTAQNVIVETPFDTGRAKANWHISNGKMASDIHKLTKDEDGSEGLSQEASMARVLAWKGFKMNATTYLVNNLTYIVPLEWGSSQQRPNGWVRNNAIELQKKLDEIKDLI